MLAADTRLTNEGDDGGLRVASDEYQKVYRSSLGVITGTGAATLLDRVSTRFLSADPVASGSAEQLMDAIIGKERGPALDEMELRYRDRATRTVWFMASASDLWDQPRLAVFDWMHPPWQLYAGGVLVIDHTNEMQEKTARLRTAMRSIDDLGDLESVVTHNARLLVRLVTEVSASQDTVGP